MTVPCRLLQGAVIVSFSTLSACSIYVRQLGTGITARFNDESGAAIESDGFLWVQRHRFFTPRADDERWVYEIVEIERGQARIPERRITRSLKWGWYILPACYYYPAEQVSWVPCVTGFLGSMNPEFCKHNDIRLELSSARRYDAIWYWSGLLSAVEGRESSKTSMQENDFQRLETFIHRELDRLQAPSSERSADVTVH